MTESVRARAKISRCVMLVSALAWAVLLVNPGSILGSTHCLHMDAGSTASLQMLLAMNPISTLAVGWTLMSIAMMLPTLIAPIVHIYERSFSSRRFRSAMLFLLSYFLIWLPVGALFVVVQLLATVMQLTFWAAACVGFIALVWQCSPVKQLCLNRNHNHTELAAFGRAADIDVLRFGASHGVWCVGSCWALMLFPMLLSEAHNAVMFAITILMIGERLDRPGPLNWCWRGPGKLLRLIVAQTQFKLSSSITR